VSLYAAVLVLSGAADVAASITVWRRRDSPGRNGLCVVLLAAAVWSFAYALELSASSLDARELWGALKYVGTTALPPAWLVFALQYTGRLAQPRPRLIGALAVEPLVVLTLLAIPATRSLIRSYPPGPLQAVPMPRLGAVYWLHFAYTNALVLAASAILLLAVMRVSRLYWRQSITLMVAICLPIIGNAMSSVHLPPFGHLDPSPVAVSLAAWVLVIGVLRYRLLDLKPVARTVVVETMRDAVLVVDAQGHVVDLNPAAQQLVGRSAGGAVGRTIDSLLAGRTRASDYAEPGVYDLRFDDQDRDLWDMRQIDEGRALLQRAMTRRRTGPYLLQAAIADLHLHEPRDWRQIAALYETLARQTGSPIVEMNRAIAVAEIDGPEAGLAILDRLDLDHYRFFHSTRAELLRRAGRDGEAHYAYRRALDLAQTEPEHRFLPAGSPRPHPPSR